MPKITRAIVSVTDKTGIVDFCRYLSDQKVEIISTGGTAKVLAEAGIRVIEISDYTGFPEMLDGRLKTLHPKVEGGILGIRKNADHQASMKKEGILPIDLVVVNLYAFEKTVAKDGCTLEHAIENIDIGGPTMLRAAAKNHPDVSVVVDPADYPVLVEEMKRSGGSVSVETNFKLAVKVFQTTARYDTAISAYFTPKLSAGVTDGFPQSLSLNFEKAQELRYGENPHQKAAAYCQVPAAAGSLITARQLHGKELSFNNFIDLEAALNAVREFKDPACVIIKHTNPCGVALGKTLAEAFARARETDPTSSFGGIVGLNQKVDAKTAQALGDIFFECIIAPGYEEEAFKILAAKKNIRLMELNPFYASGTEWDVKKIGGGLLVQDKDAGSVNLRECVVPTKRKPTEDEYAELAFAWKVAKHVKSNAIVFTKNRQALGVGAGQMSRVDSAKIAVLKSQQSLKGSVLASDAFFPFRDGLDEAAKQGITAVVQPGGSVRDEEVIAAANEHNLAMVFTSMRHFKH